MHTTESTPGAQSTRGAQSAQTRAGGRDDDAPEVHQVAVIGRSEVEAHAASPERDEEDGAVGVGVEAREGLLARRLAQGAIQARKLWMGARIRIRRRWS